MNSGNQRSQSPFCIRKRVVHCKKLKSDAYDGVTNSCDGSQLEVLAKYLGSAGVSGPLDAAENLLCEFGNIAGVLSGEWRRVSSTAGQECATLVLAASRLLRSALVDEIREQPIVDSGSLFNFIKYSLCNLTHERLVAIYINSRRRLISIDEIGNGSVDDVEVNVQKILRRGLEIGAAAFYLIHNHPSGDANPSGSDVVVTQRLAWLAKELNIPMLEHLVAARSGISSIPWR